MRPAALLILALSIPAGASVASAETAGGVANGRYAMLPAPSGVLRLDTRTGALALCTVAADAPPQCRLGTDERAGLQKEIDRLQAENAELKAKLAAAPPAASAPAPAEAAPAPRAESDDERFDKALDFADRFMRRMMRIMREDRSGEHT
jgi:hypothetical protein